MPRYGLDATPMLGRRTGIGRLVEELVAGLATRLAADEELVLCARTFRLNPLLCVSHEPLRRAARRPRVSYRCLWPPTSVLQLAGRNWAPLEMDLWTPRLDLFHGTTFLLPASRTRPGIVTVHDLDALRHPEHVTPRFAAWFRRAVESSAPRARVVLADSDATARDVEELLGVERSRIVTIHPGVGDAFFAAGDPEADRRRLGERHGLAFPILLFVGTTHPRKNLARLLDAFALARRRGRLPHRLVLAGDRGFGDAAVRARIASLALDDAVTLLGYADEADMPALYRTADALAFPSLHEGFGLPVVEAMAAGCPVITSTTSSLPEVAGDAAVLVDPTSVDAIAGAIAGVLGDAALRTRLADAGRRRAREFTWDRFADGHLAVYRDVARGARP